DYATDICHRFWLQMFRQSKSINVQLSGRILGREKALNAIHRDVQTVLIQMIVDRATQIAGPLPLPQTILLTHKYILSTKPRPTTRSEIECFISAWM